jgi:hypothetical protein
MAEKKPDRNTDWGFWAFLIEKVADALEHMGKAGGVPEAGKPIRWAINGITYLLSALIIIPLIVVIVAPIAGFVFSFGTAWALVSLVIFGIVFIAAIRMKASPATLIILAIVLILLLVSSWAFLDNLNMPWSTILAGVGSLVCLASGALILLAGSMIPVSNRRRRY